MESPDDITEELISKIKLNQIDSLTINYEFTKGFQGWEVYCLSVDECGMSEADVEDAYYKWTLTQKRTNPFWGLNLRRIEFEIILGPNVRSLAGAFADQPNLEYINLQNTSNIADMSWMFLHDRSFNQAISNWDTLQMELITKLNRIIYMVIGAIL